MSVFRVILVRISPASSSIWTEDGEILRISPYSVQMRESEGKMRTRITPNTDTFYVMHPISSAYHENMTGKFCKLYKSQLYAIFFFYAIFFILCLINPQPNNTSTYSLCPMSSTTFLLTHFAFLIPPPSAIIKEYTFDFHPTNEYFS